MFENSYNRVFIESRNKVLVSCFLWTLMSKKFSLTEVNCYLHFLSVTSHFQNSLWDETQRGNYTCKSYDNTILKKLDSFIFKYISLYLSNFFNKTGFFDNAINTGRAVARPWRERRLPRAQVYWERKSWVRRSDLELSLGNY